MPKNNYAGHDTRSLEGYPCVEHEGEKCYQVASVATVFRTAKSTIYRYIKDGKLIAVKLGAKWVTKSSIDRLIGARR